MLPANVEGHESVQRMHHGTKIVLHCLRGISVTRELSSNPLKYAGIKRNIQGLIVGIGIALLLSACAGRSYFEKTKAAMSQKEIAACKARGGSIVPVCLSGGAACVAPYKDAGRRCTDGSQCAGDCRFDSDAFYKEFGRHAQHGEEVSGVCEANNYPCGCKDYVVGGKVNAGICWD